MNGAGGNGPAVVVVDAGVGNLGNVARALTHLGATPEISRDPARVAAARCLVLPGVGAFAPPREALRGPLEAALAAALAGGAWLLGICVGFQLLFEAGEEWSVTDGLGLLPGRVTRLPAGVPVPHIGWNRLHDLADHPLLAGLGSGSISLGVPMGEAPTSSAPAVSASRSDGLRGTSTHYPGLRAGADRGEAADGADRRGRHFYFVHSYAPEDVPAELCLARATHGRSFTAVAARGRVMGTQFHPERSGAAGLRLLANFLELADGTAAGH